MSGVLYKKKDFRNSIFSSLDADYWTQRIMSSMHSWNIKIQLWRKVAFPNKMNFWASNQTKEKSLSFFHLRSSKARINTLSFTYPVKTPEVGPHEKVIIANFWPVLEKTKFQILIVDVKELKLLNLWISIRLSPQCQLKLIYQPPVQKDKTILI